MSTSTIQSNILYGLGEGTNVADATSLTYALRWANAAYRQLNTKIRQKSLQKRSVFRTAAGQQSYQAPSDFVGFVVLKDESNDSIIGQRTPEEFAKEVSSNSITDESFTSDFDVAVSLDNTSIIQYSETVTDDTSHTTTYTRDTDYEMDYDAGTITVLSTGTITDATTTYIDYLYHTDGKPDIFCLEYDATNGKFVFRLSPTPDAIYIYSLVYPAMPSALSGAVDSIWEQFEYCLERGGIYFGSLEVLGSDDPKINIFQNLYSQTEL